PQRDSGFLGCPRQHLTKRVARTNLRRDRQGNDTKLPGPCTISHGRPARPDSSFGPAAVNAGLLRPMPALASPQGDRHRARWTAIRGQYTAARLPARQPDAEESCHCRSGAETGPKEIAALRWFLVRRYREPAPTRGEELTRQSAPAHRPRSAEYL